MGVVRTRRRAVVDRGGCVACGSCVKVCPVSAIRIVGGMYAKIEDDKCVGCGKCKADCPASVIAMEEYR